MYSRWFNAAVVVLWLATMSWLVTEKVLPPLLVGEPPSYHQVIEAQNASRRWAGRCRGSDGRSAGP